MERNTELFTQKYREIYKDMYRFALYTLKHPQDAEDVVSETVLDGWRSLHLLRSEDAFRPWMFRILTNKCRQKLKNYIDKTVELPEDLPLQEKDNAMNMDLRNAFFRLDPEERLIIALHLFSGYTTKEIALLLDRREGTIRSRQSRALKKMELFLSN